MGELEDRLNRILSDPAQMEQITSMAKSLLGGQETPQERIPVRREQEPAAGETLDPAMLGRLSAALGSVNRTDDKQALLEAMKPYLSQRRREKLERAVKLAKMIHMAELAFGAMGGGGNAKI